MSVYDLVVTNFLRIFRILDTRLKRRVMILFGWMMCLSITELGSILLLTMFFSALNTAEHFRSAWYIQKIFSLLPWLEVYSADERKFIFFLSFFPVLAIFGKNILNFLVNRRMAMLGEQVAAYIGHGIMYPFLHMPYAWHLSPAGADAFTRMSWRHSLGQFLVFCLVTCSNLLTTGLLFCGLLVGAPGTTLVVLLAMGTVATLTYMLLRDAIDTRSAHAAIMNGRESRATLAAVRGIREVLIYRQQKTFLKAIEAPITEAAPLKAFLVIAPALPTWTLESCGFFLISATVGTLVYVHNARTPEIVATVALLSLSAWRVLPSLNRAVGAIVNLRSHAPMAIPCLEYFEGLQDVPEENIAEPEPGFSITRSISLRDVSFTYPKASEPSLKRVNLDIPKGSFVGIIGRSGAGKSTLINVLSGLLTPTTGELRVDGNALAPRQLAAYREQVGYVPQSPFLMPGTVAENVAFSRWGKPYDPERVRAACAEAAVDFLGPNCEDIERSVGEGGSGFSGGQAQRISIARALYPLPSVLILDEATSSLDHGGETAIQRSLTTLKGGITCIIAAHRLTTLELCDMIILLEDGEFVESGPPEILLVKYTQQLQGLT